MPPAKKLNADEEAPNLLIAGDAVLMADGGEAILLGYADGEALLRCGTGHGDPIRRPAGEISFVDPADESARHAKFRAHAVQVGELVQ